MAGGATKRTKKFISTKLDSTIQARKKLQKKKKLHHVNQDRKKKIVRGASLRKRQKEDGEEEEEDGSEEDDEDLDGEESDEEVDAKPANKLSVDDFLNQRLGDDDDEDDEDEDGAGEEDEADNSLDELEDESDEEGDHMADLSALAKKDPAFFKYLQENDADLLNFDAAGAAMDEDSDDDQDEDDDEGDSEVEDASDAESGPATKKGKKGAAKAGGKEVVTMEMLRTWQTAILQHRSLRALRRLLLAFRAAAQLNAGASSAAGATNAGNQDSGKSKRKKKVLRKQRQIEQGADDDDTGGYVVQDGKVYQKIIQTAMKYTPLALVHHIPYKEIHPSNGSSAAASGKKGKKNTVQEESSEQASVVRYKLPTESKKYATLRRPIQSFFFNLSVLLKTLPDGRRRGSKKHRDEDDDESDEEAKQNEEEERGGLLRFVVEESSRMVPYIVVNQRRKMARDYIKLLLHLWSSASDTVRMSSFLALRKVASAGDGDVLDDCLKGSYHGFVRSTKLTTQHTLPSINLMKNSASQLYLIDSTASYQQAFGFIRQLAIHLRTCLHVKTKESYQGVYNWQFIHCIDFWSLILSAACDQKAASDPSSAAAASAAVMEPLIYPLVQVAFGAIRLIPTSRYFPLRLHLLRSLLRLVQRTGVYIPLAPYLIEMYDSPDFSRKVKGSSLKPLDLQVNLRAPAAYLKTSIYADQVGQEIAFLLLEFMATQATSIAFPELSIPIVVQLKRHLKAFPRSSGGAAASGGKPGAAGIARTEMALKTLVDKISQQKAWIEKKRSVIDYAPSSIAGRAQLQNFLRDAPDRNSSPLEAAVRLARKVRDQKAKLLQQSSVQIDG